MGRKKKSDPFAGLSKVASPSLDFMQLVNVVSGKHKGKSGNVFHIREEGQNQRLQIKVNGEPDIYVDADEIDYKFEAVNIKLMLPEEEHAAWDQRCYELDQWNKGNPDYISF